MDSLLLCTAQLANWPLGALPHHSMGALSLHSSSYPHLHPSCQHRRSLASPCWLSIIWTLFLAFEILFWILICLTSVELKLLMMLYCFLPLLSHNTAKASLFVIVPPAAVEDNINGDEYLSYLKSPANHLNKIFLNPSFFCSSYRKMWYWFYLMKLKQKGSSKILCQW